MSYIDKLNKLCNEYIGFDPNNEQECLDAVIRDIYNLHFIKNSIYEKIKLEVAERCNVDIYVLELYFGNIEDDKSQIEDDKSQIEDDKSQIEDDKSQIEDDKSQIEEIRRSGYDMEIIILCPAREEIANEILDNLMIKDIIE